MQEVQHITDADGKPTGVIVPIEVWDEIGSGSLRDRINDLKRLFKKTQSLPNVKSVSEVGASNEIDYIRALNIRSSE